VLIKFHWHALTSSDLHYRYKCLLRRGSFLNYLAARLVSSPLSFCSGFAPDGDLFISFSIGCWCCIRYNNISSITVNPIDSKHHRNMQAVDQFVLLADVSEKVPKLSKDRAYANFQLTKKDWDRLEIIHEVLRVRAAPVLSI